MGYRLREEKVKKVVNFCMYLWSIQSENVPYTILKYLSIAIEHKIFSKA
jgi:hypothetical protein